MRLEKSIDVQQPVERVFDYVTSTEHFPEWASAIVEVRQTSPGPVGKDATYAIVGKFLGRKVETATRVTAYEPPGGSSTRPPSGRCRRRRPGPSSHGRMARG